MKPITIKTIKLKDHIYGGFLTITIGSWADYEKAIKKIYGKNAPKLPYKSGDTEADALGGYHGMMFAFGLGAVDEASNTNDIWVNGGLPKKEIVACLSHELLHAALSLMDTIGVDVHDKVGNQETITYWHTWALRACLKELDFINE